MKTNLIYDIEVFRNFFLYVDYDIRTGEWNQFLITPNKNEIQEFKKYITNRRSNCNFMFGFNNINYDYPIIHRILTNNNITNEEIYQLSQSLISAKTYKEKSPFLVAKWKYIIPQADLFKIWHFDNKAKKCSLKWVQFMMDYPNIQDLPIDPTKNVDLSEDSVNEIIDYCKNDVHSTFWLYLITKGEVPHSTALKEYVGKNKLSLRIDIQREYGFDCLNFNDVKIGEHLMKSEYARTNGLDPYELQPVKQTRKFTFRECFPSYIEFETQHLKNFVDSFADQIVEAYRDEDDKKTKQEFKITINKTIYCIAKGGIHSEDKARIIHIGKDEILQDADVGSQYPNSLRKRRLYPIHLGPTYLDNYSKTISSRLEAKKKFKETKDYKFKSFDEMFKLALNGGSYGKLGEETNWQYDPFVQMCVTIGNQMEILMLIEKLELNGITVISANTDGILCLFHRSLLDKYYEICKWWENIVGNNELGQLEFKEYKFFAQLSVNDYIAIDDENKLKLKGDFLTQFEIHKNKSNRVVALALSEYFQNKIKPEHFIKNHKNIYDFCLSVKGDKESKFFLLNTKTNEKRYLQKTNRFYISNSTNILVKELQPLENKIPTNQIDIFGEVDDGTRYTRIEVGYNVNLFNTYINKEFEDYDINYNYYVEKCYNIINQLENNYFQLDAHIF
jgi:hypothetical protein